MQLYSGFVLKTRYDTDKSELENKIPDISGLVKKTDYNTKITEIEDKIPDFSNLATKTALTTVKNKILDINNLATKPALTTVENEIPNISNLATKILGNKIENKLNNHNHDKYIDTLEFNKLVVDVFNARKAQANLIRKTDFDAKLSSLNRKITKNKTKLLLVENELNNLKTFDFSYFDGKSHFEEDGSQNYLIFQPMYKYLKTSDSSNYVLSWTSKGLSNESIKHPSVPNYFLNPTLNYLVIKTRIKFSGSCLKQDKVIYNHEKIVNIYIVYEINKKDDTVISDPTLENCLFGAVTLTKTADIDKYGSSGSGIGFDRKRSFSFPGRGYGENVIFFGVDMIIKKDILILGTGPT